MDALLAPESTPTRPWRVQETAWHNGNGSTYIMGLADPGRVKPGGRQVLVARVFVKVENGVTDRRNGATDVRRNGASNRCVKRRPEGVKTGLILQPFEGWV